MMLLRLTVMMVMMAVLGTVTSNGDDNHDNNQCAMHIIARLDCATHFCLATVWMVMIMAPVMAAVYDFARHVCAVHNVLAIV